MGFSRIEQNGNVNGREVNESVELTLCTAQMLTTQRHSKGVEPLRAAYNLGMVGWIFLMAKEISLSINYSFGILYVVDRFPNSPFRTYGLTDPFIEARAMKECLPASISF